MSNKKSKPLPKKIVKKALTDFDAFAATKECMNPEQLKSKRAALGLTQQKLALGLGVTTNTVKRWEMGMHPIPPWVVKILRLVEAPLREPRK